MRDIIAEIKSIRTQWGIHGGANVVIAQAVVLGIGADVIGNRIGTGHVHRV
jgi:hypothetical protein